MCSAVGILGDLDVSAADEVIVCIGVARIPDVVATRTAVAGSGILPGQQKGADPSSLLGVVARPLHSQAYTLGYDTDQHDDRSHSCCCESDRFEVYSDSKTAATGANQDPANNQANRVHRTGGSRRR